VALITGNPFPVATCDEHSLFNPHGRGATIWSPAISSASRRLELHEFFGKIVAFGRTDAIGKLNPFNSHYEIVGWALPTMARPFSDSRM
jgi:hypothetical protein